MVSIMKSKIKCTFTTLLSIIYKNTIDMRITIILFTLATIFFFSCESDPCENRICANDGTCIDGTCECLDGFGGEVCEDLLEPNKMFIEGITNAFFWPFDINGNLIAEDDSCFSSMRFVITRNQVEVYNESILERVCPDQDITFELDRSIEIVPDGLYWFEFYGTAENEEKLVHNDLHIIRVPGATHDPRIQVGGGSDNDGAIYIIDVSYQF